MRHSERGKQHQCYSNSLQTENDKSQTISYFKEKLIPTSLVTKGTAFLKIDVKMLFLTSIHFLSVCSVAFLWFGICLQPSLGSTFPDILD